MATEEQVHEFEAERRNDEFEHAEEEQAEEEQGDDRQDTGEVNVTEEANKEEAQKIEIEEEMDQDGIVQGKEMHEKSNEEVVNEVAIENEDTNEETRDEDAGREGTEPPQAQCEQTPEESMAVDEHPEEPKTPQAKPRRSSKSAKTPSLQAAVGKVKRLQEEADEADAAIAAEVAKIEELRARIVEAEARVADMRTAAAAKRAAVQRASQEYLRQQCQASIAHLEACIPKRPPNPFVMFRAENVVQGVSRTELNKTISEKWANLGEEEKRKYQERYAAEVKKFQEWSASEEGQKNLRERTELISKCKGMHREELDEAVTAADPKRTSTGATPAKRKPEAQETPLKEPRPEMAAKHRRIAASTASPPTKEPTLDERVMEEAGKADLLIQLRNLAARPEILAAGKSSQELLDALRANRGMVNAAKHALLSA